MSTKSKSNRAKKLSTVPLASGTIYSRQINSQTVLDDELGRLPFAEGIGRLIQNYSQKECLVLGVEGPWGEGKSYTVEQIKGILQKEIDSGIYKWISFRPWNFTDEQHLIRLFLRELSRAISPAPSKIQTWIWDKSAPAAKSASKFLKILVKYPWLFRLLVICILFLVYQTTELWGKLLGFLGVATVVINPSIFKLTTSSLTDSAKQLEELASLLDDYADSVGDLKDPENNQTIEEQKLEIEKALGQEDLPFKRLIIVIEDIDRLNSGEIRQVMQLTRAVADFPKIIYVLCYDREQVVRALGETGGWFDDQPSRKQYGEGYLRKVVQAGYRLPTSSRTAISSVLLKHWQEMVGNIYKSDYISTSYWKECWSDLSGLFPNVREGERVLSRAVIVSSMLGEKTNPVDVIFSAYCMESQRKLWDYIWENMNGFLNGDVNKSDLSDTIEGNQREKERIINLIVKIFPGVSLPRFSITKEIREAARLASDDHFESYFRYQIGGSALAKDWVPLLLETRSSRERIRQLTNIRSRGDDLFTSFVQGLRERFEMKPLPWRAQAMPILTDLGAVFDWDPRDEGPFTLQPANRIKFLALRWISELPREERAQAVLELVSQWIKVDARSCAIGLIDHIGQDNGWISVEPHGPDRNLVVDIPLSPEQQLKLRKLLNTAINTWLNENPFKWLDHPMAASMLFQWLRIEPMTAENKLAEWRKDDWKLFKILKAMITRLYRSSSEGEEVIVRISPHGLDKLTGMNLGQLEDRIKSVTVENTYVADQHPEVLDAFEAMKKTNKI